MDDTKSKNYNLILAEALLYIIEHKKHYVLDGHNVLSLGEEEIYQLSPEETLGSLINFDRLGILSFVDEEDRYNDIFKGTQIYFDKDKLRSYVQIAENYQDAFIKKCNNKQNKELALKVLTLLLERKKEQTIELSDVNREYIPLIEWIADYSGAIRIIYKDEVDFDYSKETGKAYPNGIYQEPKSIAIINQEIIEELNAKLQLRILIPTTARVKLFLEKNKGILWRCASCGHFLQVPLTEEKTAFLWLNNFKINKFRICLKCRAKNLFSIDKNGGISFYTTKKMTYKELSTKRFPTMKKTLRLNVKK